jgi:hypothetical protein
VGGGRVEGVWLVYEDYGECGCGKGLVVDCGCRRFSGWILCVSECC